MEDKIKFYKNMVDKIDKLSVKEFEKLLNDNERKESCDKFIVSFLPYIYNISLAIYKTFIDMFDGYYDFEEFFNDGVLLATKLFYNLKRLDNSDSFRIYYNFFRLQLIHEIYRHHHTCTNFNMLHQMNDILKAKKKFIEDNGYAPSIRELIDITGYSNEVVEKVFWQTSLDELNDLFYYIEDDLIKEFDSSKLHDDLKESLKTVNEKTRDIICKKTGFNPNGENFPPIRQYILARDMNVTQAYIGKLTERAYVKIKKNNSTLENYL